MKPTWSLVMTMHGVPEITLPCVAYHLQTDAEFLHIYLDSPNPVVEAALATQPRCIVTVCDDTYWAQYPVHGRPKIIVGRQLANFDHARRASGSDWLIHLDADEFLVNIDPSSVPDVTGALLAVPEDHDWLRISVMERVMLRGSPQQTIFDGIFRSKIHNAELVEKVYGAFSHHLQFGLSGYHRGKIGMRRSSTLEPRLHAVVVPRPGKPKTAADAHPSLLPPFTIPPRLRLLHFEGWTSLHWVSKFIRLIEAGRAHLEHAAGRKASLGYMLANTDRKARLELFEMVQSLDPAHAAELSKAGLARLHPFNPIDLTRRVFPGVDLDFSVAAFEARLRANDPGLFERNNL